MNDIAVREQQEFERYWRRWREDRIVATAEDNPRMTISDLAERFGMTDSGMYDLLMRRGVRRERSDLRRGDWRRTGLKYSYWKRRIA